MVWPVWKKERQIEAFSGTLTFPRKMSPQIEAFRKTIFLEIFGTSLEKQPINFLVELNNSKKIAPFLAGSSPVTRSFTSAS